MTSRILDIPLSVRFVVLSLFPLFPKILDLQWDLVCQYDYAPTLALAVFGLSGLIGNYIFGYIQDGLGRKPAYYVYLLIQSVFGVATAFAPNFTTWVLLRVGVGFTVPAILGTPYVLGKSPL